MTEKCLMIIRSLKRQFPDCWQEKAADYIDQQLCFYKEHKNLAKVEIQYEFNANKHDQNFIVRFQDVFERYPNVMSCRDSGALDYIYHRYMEELAGFKKEVCHV